MVGFREENRFLIYGASIFGLYMFSIETVITNKWLLRFLTVWTKLPITLLPVYMCMDVRSIIFDEMDGLRRLAFLRKIIVFFGFCLKNVFFYSKRRSIEDLMDLWDVSFKEEFFTEKHLLNRKDNQRRNRKFISVSMALAIVAAIIYGFPSYFSKTKDIKHPSGIIHSHQSPEFEMVVTFDLIVSLTCVSAALFDCILIVFLSHVGAKLVFLRETLADIIDELIIDAEGRLLGKRTNRKVGLPEYYLRSNDDQADISGSYKDVYEERELNGEEYKRNMANIESKLRIWILHHQQTIAFFKELSKVYSSIATFELGYIVLYTGMTALNIVQMKVSVVALSTALVASSNILSLFFWCKISDELMEIDVFGDSFSQAWFLFPKKIKSAFACIIMRSQTPLSLKGFSVVVINLATFFEILKIAYQFFAFMVQISDDNS